MKPTLLTLLALSSLAKAAPVTLAWDGNAEADGITHYELRYSSASDMVVHKSVQVDEGTQHTLDLPAGEYHFEVVAVANGVTSEPSNRVSHTVRPGKPQGLVVVEITVSITR